MRRALLRGTAMLAAGAVLGIVAPRAVSAHDVHDYGTFKLALGWLHEPAYVGQPNAVQVLVKDARGAPITSITDKDLTVDLSVNGQTLSGRPLTPTADPDTGLGTPGEYEYALVPTAPGAYSFHLEGSVAGTPVDETVTAGDKTFAEVTGAADAQFPVKLPSQSDLSARLDRDAARADSAQSAADSARDAANRALVVGIVAIALVALLGGAGLVVSLRRRRPSS